MTPAILSVGYPFAPVTADPVGGAEQVLAQLDRAILAAGWRSLVIAPEGSRPAGELVPIQAAQGEIDEAARAHVHAAVRRAIGQVLGRERIDLVHLHGIDFPAYLPPPGPPVLATLHLPLAWYAEEVLRPARPLTWLNPVSAAQAASAPPGARLTAPIENGVEVEAFARPYRKRGYAVALGRICPEKGFHLALDAAKAAGVAMLLAGEVFDYAEHRRYFAAEIAPRLDSQRRWIGPVAGPAKRRLLGAARCLLAPSLVPETSSLVAREAMAAGTPVVAFPAGALKDAIEPGRTGFLVEGVAAMAAAIGRCDALEPEACRAAARDRFDVKRTTGAYLRLYRELMGLTPRPSPPWADAAAAGATAGP